MAEIPVLKIKSRAEWNARPPSRAYLTFPDSRYVGMEAHHSVGQSYVEWDRAAREIQNFHLDGKGWVDIFYAFLIHPDGTVVEGRGWNKSQGSDNMLGGGYLMPVCFLGNYHPGGASHVLELTEEQVFAWHLLRAALLGRNPQGDRDTLSPDAVSDRLPWRQHCGRVRPFEEVDSARHRRAGKPRPTNPTTTNRRTTCTRRRFQRASEVGHPLRVLYP